jgi:hypothetical protein
LTEPGTTETGGLPIFIAQPTAANHFIKKGYVDMLRMLVTASLAMLSGFGFGCMPTEARADVQTVNVVSVGGQGSNMFVLFSHQVGTDQGCAGTRLILATGVIDAASQSRFYAALLLAFATGTQVTLSVSSCYGNYPAMSASDWWFVPQEG